jgi:hypothetical protein
MVRNLDRKYSKSKDTVLYLGNALRIVNQGMEAIAYQYVFPTGLQTLINLTRN